MVPSRSNEAKSHASSAATIRCEGSTPTPASRSPVQLTRARRAYRDDETTNPALDKRSTTSLRSREIGHHRLAIAGAPPQSPLAALLNVAPVHRPRAPRNAYGASASLHRHRPPSPRLRALRRVRRADLSTPGQQRYASHGLVATVVTPEPAKRFTTRRLALDRESPRWCSISAAANRADSAGSSPRRVERVGHART